MNVIQCYTPTNDCDDDDKDQYERIMGRYELTVRKD